MGQPGEVQAMTNIFKSNGDHRDCVYHPSNIFRTSRVLLNGDRPYLIGHLALTLSTCYLHLILPIVGRGPRLIQLYKGFLGGFINGGAYIQEVLPRGIGNTKSFILAWEQEAHGISVSHLKVVTCSLVI